MASYHLHEKTGRKGSAKDHSDYISRRGRYSSRQDDLLAQGHGNLPSWADTPTTFWRRADEFERMNGAVYREVILALPNELAFEQHLGLVHEYIAYEIGARTYQFAIHFGPAAIGKNHNPHAHIMFSDRIDDGIDRTSNQFFKRANSAYPELGGCKKASGGRHPREMGDDLRRRRQTWSEMQNSILATHGHAERVSHLSLAAQGVPSTPERHFGAYRVRQLDEAAKQAIRARRDW